MGLGTSFDIVFREMTLAGQRTGLFFVNGFAKDNIMLEILKRLTYLSADQLTTDALKAFSNVISRIFRWKSKRSSAPRSTRC